MGNVDIRELDRRAVETTARVIDGVGADQWELPTPCSEWTVRDVVQHMIDNNRTFVARLAGQRAPEPVRAQDPAAEFLSSFAAAAEAVREPEVLERPYELPQGVFTVGVMVGVHFADVLVHAWDIATATGQEVRFDDDLAEVAFKLVSRYPDTPDLRGPGALFDHARSVPEDTPIQDRLLALTGRAVPNAS